MLSWTCVSLTGTGTDLSPALRSLPAQGVPSLAAGKAPSQEGLDSQEGPDVAGPPTCPSAAPSAQEPAWPGVLSIPRRGRPRMAPSAGIPLQPTAVLLKVPLNSGL